VLQSAGVFWLISLGIDALQLYWQVREAYLGYGSGNVFGLDLGPYAQYFARFSALEYAARGVVIASGFIAVFCSFAAAFTWRKFKASRPPAFISYMLGYSIPFVAYLLLSNRTSVEISGIQQHLCRDIVTAQYKDPNWVPGKMVALFAVNDDNAWLVTKVVKAADSSPNLTEAFGMSPSMCDTDPKLWDGEIRKSLEKTGRLSAQNGMPCPAAMTARARTLFADAGLIPDASENITDLQKERPQVCNGDTCGVCRRVQCLSYVPAQQKAKVGKGNNTELQKVVNSKKDDMCNKCSEPKGLVTKQDGKVTAWNCNSLCVPYWASEKDWKEATAERYTNEALDALEAYGAKRNAVGAAFDAIAVFDWCIDPNEVEIMQLLTRLAVAEEPWELLLGCRGAVKAMIALFPALFALMSGTIRGAVVAKVVIPYSRIPALVLTCAISYSLPYIVLMAIVCKSVVGDFELLPAVISGIMVLMVFLPWQRMLGARFRDTRDITEPQVHAEADRAVTLRMYLHYTFGVLAFICLIYWVSKWAETFAGIVQSSLSGLEAETFREILASSNFWWNYGLSFISLIANYFGFSKIAGVCFADNVLWAVAAVDEANVDSRQQAHSEEQEVALFAELHKGLLLREPKVHVKFDRIYRKKRRFVEKRHDAMIFGGGPHESAGGAKLRHVPINERKE